MKPTEKEIIAAARAMHKNPEKQITYYDNAKAMLEAAYAVREADTVELRNCLLKLHNICRVNSKAGQIVREGLLIGKASNAAYESTEI